MHILVLTHVFVKNACQTQFDILWQMHQKYKLLTSHGIEQNELSLELMLSIRNGPLQK